MAKHVVLLTNAHEAPSVLLTEALGRCGVAVLFEGTREAETTGASTALERGNGSSNQADAQPLAVLYEVIHGADRLELYATAEHARTVWPGAPLVACRRPLDNDASSSLLRNPDNSTLKRLGFRAIADEPAQLPALLRELEDHGVTGDLRLSSNPDLEPHAPSLPKKISGRDLRAAFEMIAALHFTNDQASAANAVLGGLDSLVLADRWTIYLIPEAGRNREMTLEPLAAHGARPLDSLTPEQDWKRSLLGNALALSGSESKTAREAAAKTETLRKKEDGRHIIAVPLVSNERLMGLLEGVRESSGSRAFTKAQARLLEALARPIASALSNALRIAEAERLSQTDDLTKLHNARYLRQFILSEVRRARRYGSSVAALFFDLDDFKHVNDVHGHLVGSHVLMEMAAIILSSVRDTDAVARYGGDEFVVVLPESNMEQAAFVAERVRQKIEKNAFTGGRGLQLRLTASFGVATFPTHAQSPQQLVACADAAMYDAKAAGKNCVRFAIPPSIPENEQWTINDRRRSAHDEESSTVN